MKRSAHKLLALLLTLALTMALTVPAFAAEDWMDLDPDEFGADFAEDYQAQHPQEYAAFDANTYFKDNVGLSYWTKEEYMTVFELADEAAFRDAMWSSYLTDKSNDAYQAALLAAYRTAHPGELEKLDLKSVLSAMGYREPMDAYMNDGGYATEAEARDALYLEYVQARAALADAQEEGAVYEAANPGSRAAFDADAFFEDEYHYWTDKEEYMASRFLKNDTEFADSLFAEWTWSQYWGGSFGDPNAPLSLVANGTAAVLPEGMELYQESGVTYAPADTLSTLLNTKVAGDAKGYAPVRAAAETAGWDVVWNGMARSVVLLDKTAVMADLEKDFGAFDALLARAMESSMPTGDDAYLTTATADLRLTRFNSLDGDTTATATVTSELLRQGRVMDLTVTLRAADLLKLMTPEMRAKLNESGSKLTFTQLRTLITGLKAHIIYNLDDGMVYMNLPFLAGFVEGAAKDTWYSMDLGLGEMDTALLPDFTLCGMLYGQLLSQSTDSWSTPEDAFAEFTMTKEQLLPLFGSARVTESNGTLTYSLPTGVMNGLCAGLMSDESFAPFQDYALSLSMNKSGRFSMDMVIRPDMAGIAGAVGTDFADTALYTFAMGLLDMRMTTAASGNADSGTERTELHWKNQVRLNIDESYTRAKTTRSPAAAPPDNADVRDLFGGIPADVVIKPAGGMDILSNVPAPEPAIPEPVPAAD